MDPVANVVRQRQIAEQLVNGADGSLSADEEHALAVELAELVLALAEWRKRGGWDPYGA